MNLQIDIDQACEDPAPDEDDIRRWITAALEDSDRASNSPGNLSHKDQDAAEISVRLVDEREMSTLNETWRGKAGTTNVLSFPSDLPAGVQHPLLGDIVICSAVVAREAVEQHKTDAEHWAHMLVHGCLHLLGYDHVEVDEAELMEDLERKILDNLGYPDPYRDTSSHGNNRSHNRAQA